MTTIGELGEDALIAAFAPRLPTTDSELLGPGDDAAVISVDGDLVVSSDVLVEGRHFRLDWSTGEDVGWRAAVQNLADIDAMGAVPTALQVTLAAPAEHPRRVGARLRRRPAAGVRTARRWRGGRRPERRE